MTTNDLIAILEDKSTSWQHKPVGAPHEVLARLNQQVANMPEEYLVLLEYSNGPEGSLKSDPCWFAIWAAEKVLENNRSYEISTNLPGFLAFGSNGGGELLAFKEDRDQGFCIYTVPFILMNESDAVIIANDFRGFFQLMGEESERQA
jgi:hypothetical protein